MNHFETTILGRLLEPALSLRLTLTLLHFLWQGSLLGLAALAADYVSRRAFSRTRYAIFVGILATMGAALPATFLLVRTAEPQTKLASAPAPPPAAVVMTNASPAVTPRAIGKASRSADSIPETEPELITDLGPTNGFIESPPTANELPTTRLKPYAAAVTLAYLTGIVLMLTRLAVALQGGRRLRLAATPISEGPITELVRRQAIQLGLKTAPLVAWCGRVSVPVVVGIVRPMILLPTALATGFDPLQLEALLTHELAHIRRFDPLVNLLQRLIEVALFFHPAVWYVSRRVSAERENACDDLVLSAGWPAIRYAQALLQMAEFCAARGISPQSNAALAASGGHSSQFKRRVLRLLEIDDGPRLGLSRQGTVLAVAAAVLTLMAPTLIRAVTAQGQAAGALQQQPDQSLVGGKSATLARVFAAWKARQERVQSFHLSWTTRVTLQKGFVLPFPDEPLIAGLRPGDFADPAEKQIDIAMPPSEWWGEGASRFRSDFRSVGNDGANGWKQLAQVRIIRDGSLFSRLLVPVNARESPSIDIWRESAIKDSNRASVAGDLRLKWHEVDLAPLRLALRPMIQVSSESAPIIYNSCAWSPDNCQVVGENAIVGNVHCIKLQQNVNNHFETCWVDPKRDYVVVYWERRIADRPARSVAIEYRQDREHGWLPWRWTCEVAGNAGQRSSIEATVTQYTINEPFHEYPFGKSYPPGTQVFDVTADRPDSGIAEQSRGPQPQKDRATFDAIAAAWGRRQAKFKSFKFNWKRKSADSSTSTHALSVDGVRFATTYLNADRKPFRFATGAKKGPGHPADTRLVFDGSTTTDLLITDIRKLVTIHSGLREREVQHMGDRALLDALRPLEPQLAGIDLSKFRVAGGGGQIGEAHCVIIQTEENGGRQKSYWLDPARDYLLLREHRTANGQDRMRVDLSYRSDPRFGWVPTGWTYAFAGGDGVTDTVTDSIVNQPLPDSEFKIEIPEAAQVNDMRKRKS
jgi:beta-lactamase regulating signal transducer with metallopeptidase domain